MQSRILKSKLASLGIVWCLVFSLFAGLILVGVPSIGRAALPSYLPNGDVLIGRDYDVSTWTIDGSVHYMDGNLTIRTGGVVHVINGGLSFTQDCGMAQDPKTSPHVYTLTIEDGGQLILEHSNLTTQLNQIYDFPSLGVIVQNGGRLEATDNSLIEFPGHMVVDNSTFVLSDSVIRGHDNKDIKSFCNQSFFPADYFDDSPVLLFTSSNVLVENSIIEDIFANDPNTNATRVYNNTYSFATDTGARDSVFYTLSRMPISFGTGNSATGVIGDIRMDDLRYSDLAPTHVLRTNLSDLNGLVFEAASVRLNVEYHTDPGYTHNDPLYYSYENGVMVNSGLMITDTSAAYDTSINGDVKKSIALPAMSAEDLNHLNLRLTNTDPSATIHINRIWFTINLAFPSYRSLTVAMDTKMTAIDSYIGVDFSNDRFVHNTLQVYDTAECYLYGTSFNMVKTASSPADREPAVVTNDVPATFTPLAKAAADSTSQLVRNVTVFRDLIYAVVSGGRVFALDEFNTSDMAGSISSATLNIAYLAPGATPPSNYFQWGLEGQPLRNTSIRPQLSLTLKVGTFDLYSAGVRTVSQLSDLNIRYNSIPGESDVWIDAVWINVTLRPTAYIYRWANVNVSDEQGLPVPGATVEASMMLGGAQAQYYSPSGVSTTPPAEVLAYLGRSAGNYTKTGTDGTVRIPLLSEFINASSMPNSQVVGDYLLNISYQNASSVWFYAEAGVSFQPYPEMGIQSQEVDVIVDGLYLVPDLSIDAGSVSVWPAVPMTGDVVYINATVSNSGPVDAVGATVELWIGAVRVSFDVINVSSEDSAVAQLTWMPTMPGVFTLTILVNPQQTIHEASYANNDVSVDVTVEVQTGPADLVVQGTSTVILNGTAFSYARVVVRDSGTLYVTNGFLNINQGVTGAICIFVQDNAKLIIGSASITSNKQIWMCVFGNGQLILDNAQIGNSVGLRLDGNAHVSMEGCVVGSDIVAPLGSNAVLAARNTTFQVQWSHFGGSSVALLTAVQIPRVVLADAAMAILYQWIDVTVLDGNGIPLANASVQLSWNVNFTMFARGMTDAQGKMLFEALSDVLSAPNAPEFFGNYLLNATYRFNGARYDSAVMPVSLNPYAEPLLRNDAVVDVAIPGALPDLDPPINVSTHTAYRGDNVTVTTNVTNAGVVPAYNVVVRFKDGSTLIVNKVITKISPGQMIVVSTVWQAVAPLGPHNISVTVDPEGIIKEMTKHNNQNWTTVTVMGIPDLSIAPTDVLVDPGSPTTNTTDPVSIDFTIHNGGDADGNGVQVVLKDIQPNGTYTIATIYIDVPKQGLRNYGPVSWIPVMPGSHTILVDVSLTVPDHANLHTNASVAVTVRNYADFAAEGIQFTPTQVNVGGLVSIDAFVSNTGETDGYNVMVSFYLGSISPANKLGDRVIGHIAVGASQTATLTWTVIANTDGKVQYRTIFVQVNGGDNPIKVIGHANPITSAQVKVVDTRPDLLFVGGINVTNSGGQNVNSAMFGEVVTVSVKVKNDGYSTAQNALIELSALDSMGFPTMIQNKTQSILANQTVTIQFVWTVNLAYPYDYTLKVQLDRPNTIMETLESNNNVTKVFRVNAPSPDIHVAQPVSESEFSLDSPVLVNGYIYNSITTGPLANISVVTKIVDPVSHQQVGFNQTTMTTLTGWYQTVLHVPADIQGGQSYNVVVEVKLGNTTSQQTTSINVKAQVVETGMPLWVWILIIVVVLAGVIAVSFVAYRGLGRMVECGECGALIPESAKKCPKCGTAFETGTAKCSQCGAWIPASAVSCPECGAKFVTEPMAEEEDEYIKGMRRHYDEYVDAFREQGKAALGKKYNETRFLEWYKKQPSYISFEKWLSQEEEKRKTATAFACPVCGTLNPRGSTICHKCGTVFGGQAGGVEPAEAAAVEQKPIRRIVRRPAEKKVVQKRPEDQVPPEQKPPEEASGPTVEEQKPEEPKNQ